MTRFGDVLRGTASPSSSSGPDHGSSPRHGTRWTPRHMPGGDARSARHASDDGESAVNGQPAPDGSRPGGSDARPRQLNGNPPRHAPVGSGQYPPSVAPLRRAPASGPSGRGPLNWAPVDAIDGPTQKLPTIPAPRPGTGSQRAVPTTRPQVQPEPGQEETQTEWLPRATIRRRRRRAKRRRLLEWPILVGLALLVALVVRTFVLQSFYIPSGSMFDTLKINNRVVVNKLSYHLHPIHRGDVVVFNRPKNVNISDKDLIKRVIGLPGDVLSAHGGSVYVGDRRLSEPYVKASCHGTSDFGPVTVPKHDIFVMGDNRCDSYDSRYFGAIPQSLVVGRAFLLIWPLSRFGAL